MKNKRPKSILIDVASHSSCKRRCKSATRAKKIVKKLRGIRIQKLIKIFQWENRTWKQKYFKRNYLSLQHLERYSFLEEKFSMHKLLLKRLSSSYPIGIQRRNFCRLQALACIITRYLWVQYIDKGEWLFNLRVCLLLPSTWRLCNGECSEKLETNNFSLYTLLFIHSSYSKKQLWLLLVSSVLLKIFDINTKHLLYFLYD